MRPNALSDMRAISAVLWPSRARPIATLKGLPAGLAVKDRGACRG